MKYFKIVIGRALRALVIFSVCMLIHNGICAQKILSEMETQFVMEAHSELNKALSDPTMDQAERIRIVERSAQTLKEYGQPDGFPNGDIQLKQLMQGNYN